MATQRIAALHHPQNGPMAGCRPSVWESSRQIAGALQRCCPVYDGVKPPAVIGGESGRCSVANPLLLGNYLPSEAHGFTGDTVPCLFDHCSLGL